jgi:hypothetical protein
MEQRTEYTPGEVGETLATVTLYPGFDTRVNICVYRGGQAKTENGNPFPVCIEHEGKVYLPVYVTGDNNLMNMVLSFDALVAMSRYDVLVNDDGSVEVSPSGSLNNVQIWFEEQSIIKDNIPLEWGNRDLTHGVEKFITWKVRLEGDGL